MRKLKHTVWMVPLLLIQAFAGMGQDITNYINHHNIRTADSMRLAHYLVGCGILNGAGEFVKNRRVYVDSALSVAPWSADLWFQKAFPLLFAGKYEIGMPCLDSAVKYDEVGYIAWRGYMKCIFQKHYRESIHDFNKARELHVKDQIEDHPLNFFTGLCYLQLNQFDSSEYLFRNSIKKVTDANGPEAVNYLEWFYLGIVLFEKDDYTGAITCFDNCLRPYPKFSDAEFYKSWCLHEMDRNNDAYALMKDSKRNFMDGYTINDDNAHIEPYPYQVSRYNLDHSLEIMEKKVKPRN